LHIQSLRQELPVGTSIFSALRAKDADSPGPNSEISYEILDLGSTFEVYQIKKVFWCKIVKKYVYFLKNFLSIPNSWEGNVILNQRLDFETLKNFSVKVMAKVNNYIEKS